jgi:RecB family exonuclease
MPLPRGYLSHSQIRLYIECPRKYQFCYIDEVPAPINEKIFLGTVFHATVEEYLHSRLNDTPLELPALLEVYQRRFESMQTERPIAWQSPMAQARNRGEGFIRHFYLHIAPTVRPLMIEHELEATLPDSAIVLKGVIDMVEEDHTITDFKTTTSRWTPSRANSSFQMVIYKYLYENTFGPVTSGLKYEVLYAKNSSPIRHQTIRVTYGEEETRRMLNAVRFVADSIEKGRFSPSQGHQCRYCEHGLLCRQRGG